MVGGDIGLLDGRMETGVKKGIVLLCRVSGLPSALSSKIRELAIEKTV
jgi:hypothetical protein